MGPNQATPDLFLVARVGDPTPSLPLTQHVPGYLSDTPVPDSDYKSSWPTMFLPRTQPLVRVRGPERQSVLGTEWMNEWRMIWKRNARRSEYDWASAQCVLLKHWAGSDVSGRPGSPLHRISASFPCVFASAHLFHYFHLSFQDSLTSFLEARAPWLRSWIATKKEFWSALDPQCWWLYAAPLWHQAVLQAFSRMRVLPLTLYVYSLVSHQ